VDPYGRPYPPPYYRPEKDYLAEALITMLLYLLGFGIIGFIANIVVLRNANRDEARGVYVHNKGCLQAMLWVQIAGLIVGCAAIAALLALGGFGVLFEAARGSGPAP
jgi:hypothetical protein